MTTQVYIAEDEAHFAAQAAHGIVKRIVAVQEARGRCHLALSGGATPRPVHERLAALADHGAFDADALEVWLADERCVDESSPDSNARLVVETFVGRCTQGTPRFERPWHEGLDLDGMARRYEALLPERIDVLVLGVGPDGHTASLFPGHDALRETRRRWFHIRGPKPPPDRWTMSAAMITAAAEVCVLVRGAEKAPVVARAIEGDDEPTVLPAALAREATWFLDVEAAACLRLPAAQAESRRRG